MKKKPCDGWWLIALITLTGLTIQQASSVDCPSSCRCGIDASGVFSVDCTNRELTTFPESIPLIATKLNISGNWITHLNRLEGENVLFINVTILDLSNNAVVDLHSTFLKAFSNLEYLYFKQNKLTEIPNFLPEKLVVLHLSINMITSLCHLSGSHLRELYLRDNYIDLSNGGLHCEQRKRSNTTFEFLNLEILDLSGNRIRNIDDNTFKRFPKLKHISLSNNRVSNVSFVKELNVVEVLDLSNNSISGFNQRSLKNLHNLRYLSLAFNSFVNLPSYLPTLEWLDMSFNNITHLSEEVDENELYPHDVFLLGGNPFHCDCHLQWVKDLYDLRLYLLKYIDVNLEKYIPVCATPVHLAGKSWDMLDSDQFVCSDIRKPVKDDKTPEKDHSWSPELHVSFVGQTYIKVGWIPPQGEVNSKSREMVLAYRTFGGQNVWREMSVTGNVGVYTIHDLHPDTAYLVCLKSVQVTSLDHNCVDVITLGQSLMEYYMLIGLVAVLACGSLILTICLCFFKGDSQKKQQ
ncbi:protein slit-like isoform X2 [Mizuhopecten yessoensis]|nr:protein slit-like isoform X2 [Mizuhopecten yessoensis]XP_021342731.1 protein slit-like isoform X2 [Mizuhopecten yessoensis]XP_021342738.1 protein slit-like isoform X2 [Mizuhopecten yessoensis]